MRSSSLRRKNEGIVKRIALHECGHAVADHLLKYGVSVLAVEKARWKPSERTIRRKRMIDTSPCGKGSTGRCRGGWGVVIF